MDSHRPIKMALPAILGVAFLFGCGASGPMTDVPTLVGPELGPAYVLLEPTGEKLESGLPLMRRLSATAPIREQFDEVLARPLGQWVLAIGAQARASALTRCSDEPAVCAANFDHPAYFAVVDGGNRPRMGLAIADDEGILELPQVWYVEVGPESEVSLIPHEYGHVMMFEQLPGDVPGHPKMLPHTTGAITNDIVAFSEGWGIHFETLAADRQENLELFAQMHRDRFPLVGEAEDGDSLLAARDLITYSQSYRRYTAIKENRYAYLPRADEGILLSGTPSAEQLIARWTDTTCDPARLRTLEQQVASEGLIATLFYRLATAPSPGGAAGYPGDPPLPDPERYRAFFTAFSTLTETRLEKVPAVLAFLESLLLAAPPAERRRIARIALEVFHYTPLVPEATRIHNELHALGHLMERDRFKQLSKELEQEMAAAVNRLVDDPPLLAEAAAPELWVINESVALTLAIFQIENQPLIFDLNTAPVEFLMTLPDVDYRQARSIVEYRQLSPFHAIADLAAIEGIPTSTVTAVEQMHQTYLETLRTESAHH